jgi:hypothetical protein
MAATHKTNKAHRHPDANHQPRQDAMKRKVEAQARQEVYDELTIEQKLKLLPPEPLCKKQRAKLMKQLEQRELPRPKGQG